MSDLTQLQALLQTKICPITGTDIASKLSNNSVIRKDGRVLLSLELGARLSLSSLEAIKVWMEPYLVDCLGTDRLEVVAETEVISRAVTGGGTPHAAIKNIIAVGSGKGGVGKSTSSVSLAYALAAEGARVGLLDADIYGPSVGHLLGVQQRARVTSEKKFIPIEVDGVYSMSMAYLVDEDTPMVWRGPMASGAVLQLLNDTAWPTLDYLIIDLPPGTGDIVLTITQKLPLCGAVVVTTPQDVACLDAKKALQMFSKVEVPVLGVVENMHSYHCGACGHEEALFGHGGALKLAQAASVPVLGHIPLTLACRVEADAGRLPALMQSESPEAAAWRATALKLIGALAQRPIYRPSVIPTRVAMVSPNH